MSKETPKKVLDFSQPWNPGTSLHILEIESDTDNTIIALGITEERYEELSEICKKHYEANDNIVIAMVTISKECKHANELYACSMMVTQNHMMGNRRNSPQIMTGNIGDILGEIFRRRNKGK